MSQRSPKNLMHLSCLQACCVVPDLALLSLTFHCSTYVKNVMCSLEWDGRCAAALLFLIGQGSSASLSHVEGGGMCDTVEALQDVMTSSSGLLVRNCGLNCLHCAAKC